jgi:ABC-type transport system involved in multi-copper enzyme maturation permease subunit
VTAESAVIDPAVVGGTASGPFLGLGTVLRKEITEWLRGRGAIVIAAVSLLTVAFTTLIPFVVRATGGEAAGAPPLSMDPTDNVLIGWSGQTVQLIALLATMSLFSAERDRGTLAWNLANPVSRLSIIAAKFTAAFVVIGILAVIVPLVVSATIATVAYGGVPDLARVGAFGALYLMVPAFWIALTVTLGTFIKGAGGVAGIGFAVLVIPQLLGGLLPIVLEVSPTSIGTWAMAAAAGQQVSVLTVAGWLVAMGVLAVAARVAFDRQEF